LAGDDDVEGLVLEREPLLGVDPVRLDAEPCRLVERQPVDVDAHHLVSMEVGPRQRPGAAPDVEDAPAGAADVPPEEVGALAAAEPTETCVAPVPMPVEDIRSGRPPVLSRNLVRLSLRRGASIASLVFLDLAGLALGLYVALVLRWLYYEHHVLWGVPWKAETK